MGHTSMDILPATLPDGSTSLPGKLKVFQNGGDEHPVLIFGKSEEEVTMA